MNILSGAMSDLIPLGASVLDIGCGDGGSPFACSSSGRTCGSKASMSRSAADAHPGHRLRRPRGAVPRPPFRRRPAGGRDPSRDRPLGAARRGRSPGTDNGRDQGPSPGRISCGPHPALHGSGGEQRHGVALPYHYWTRGTWLANFAALGLTIVEWKDRLGLYPWPASWLFDRSLHFVASLQVPTRAADRG